MSLTPITIWKPELLISAEATGLYVAVKAAPSAGSKPADALPRPPRQYTSRR